MQHESRDFAEQPAKLLGPRSLVPQPGEIVLNQRVRDNGHALHC